MWEQKVERRRIGERKREKAYVIEGPRVGRRRNGEI